MITILILDTENENLTNDEYSFTSNDDNIVTENTEAKAKNEEPQPG